MKKLLMIVLIVLLITLAVFLVKDGVQAQNIEIFGIKEIADKSEALDKRINEAGKLASTDFKQAEDSVKNSAKELERKKQTYDEMTIISTDGQVQSANQIEKYELERLWVQLGSHAKKENVKIKIVVEKDGTNAKDSYNLRFTVNGSYIGIQDFISDIENDSSLGFKIEDFAMVPSAATSTKEADENYLQATFICKTIFIKGISEGGLGSSGIKSIGDENQNNTSNTTGTANTTNNTNNTNATNTNVAR